MSGTGLLPTLLRRSGAPLAPSDGARTRTPRRRPVLRGAAGAAVLVLMLEAVSRSGLVDPAYLPPFSQVALTLVLALGSGALWAAIGSTLITWFLGLLFSVLVAAPLGIALGLSEIGYRASRALIELIRPMPAVALIPLVLLAVGAGLEMKIIVAMYAAVWPILFNAIYGVHGVDPRTREMAVSYGQTRAQVLFRVVVPAAAPVITTGIRISSAIVLIVVITAELVAGGAQGLGSFIAQNRAQGTQVPLVYAGILLSGLLGLTVNLALGWAERHLFGWHTQGRG